MLRSGDLTYYYQWALFGTEKRLVIVEVRKFDDSDSWSYELAGSDWGYKESDFEFLQVVEDYHEQ